MKRNNQVTRTQRRRLRAAPVGIVGVGAMGTSIGLAMRRAGAVTIGFDSCSQHLAHAKKLGALTATARDLPGLADCQAVFVGLPPEHVAHAVHELLAASSATILDIASVKSGIAAAVKHARFVPSHPLKGTHLSGPGGARADMFEDATWALCPVPETSPSSVEHARVLVKATGADPLTIDAELHDKLVATTSHLPHVVASGLAGHVGSVRPDLATRLIGDGFRDTTRIAKANPHLWAAIVQANLEQIRPAIWDLVSRLQALDGALAAGDWAAVARFFETGANALATLARKGPLDADGTCKPLETAGREVLISTSPVSQLEGAV